MKWSKNNPALSKEELMHEYYDNMRSLEDIGLDFDVHQSIVSAWMKLYGLEVRKTTRRKIPSDELRGLIRKGWTVDAMAKHFGVSRTKLRNQIKEEGLRNE